MTQAVVAQICAARRIVGAEALQTVGDGAVVVRRRRSVIGRRLRIGDRAADDGAGRQARYARAQSRPVAPTMTPMAVAVVMSSPMAPVLHRFDLRVGRRNLRSRDSAGKCAGGNSAHQTHGRRGKTGQYDMSHSSPPENRRNRLG